MSIVVLGAGVAGLSAAWHLRGRTTVKVLEAADEVGGLCRSARQAGFRFDTAGHFLHLRDARSRELLDRLLPGRFASHRRQAAIWFAGAYVPHPFQGHLGWLPESVGRECLVGFVEACERRQPNSVENAANLLEWFHVVFGEPMTRVFLEPQNRKSYCCDLTEIDAGWANEYVPQPSVAQIVDGMLLKLSPDGVGYNASFLYPVDDGIDILPKALAGLSDVRCGHRVTAVDVERRVVTCANGSTHAYSTLISTLPLDRLVAMSSGLPHQVQEQARGLRSVDVLDIRLGVTGGPQVPYQWIYFPGSDYPFARVVIPSNVTASAAPAGHSAVHVEVNVPHGEALDVPRLINEAFAGLKQLGIVSADSQLLTQSTYRIECAYVVHDHHRRKVLPGILSSLEQRGVHSIGRYGAWTYGGMESAILDGMTIAQRLEEVGA